MIRPRVRSYGDSSTRTLSPGRIRMKFFRILPETCARTWCLFSSSTLNIALGRGSMTTAITSIASSLLMHSLYPCRPYGAPTLFRTAYPALPRWANEFRRSAALADLFTTHHWPPTLTTGHYPLPRQNQRAVFGDGNAMLHVG